LKKKVVKTQDEEQLWEENLENDEGRKREMGGGGERERAG
jgi:hypothetical protein